MHFPDVNLLKYNPGRATPSLKTLLQLLIVLSLLIFSNIIQVGPLLLLKLFYNFSMY